MKMLCGAGSLGYQLLGTVVTPLVRLLQFEPPVDDKPSGGKSKRQPGQDGTNLSLLRGWGT